MPATTRNGARQKQTHIDNPAETKAAVTTSKRKASLDNETPRKRAAQSNHSQKSKATGQPQKDSSPPKDDDTKSDESKDDIIINRAPVLELWAATVTSFVYPEVSWETCLSAGSAISTLCAISKGRAIGTVDKKDPSTVEKKKQRSESDDLDELEVMSFHLKLQDGHVLVGNKPKKANEQTLIKKFGEAAYQRVKDTFRDSLQLWSGQEEELNAQAYHHYEVFRPIVPKGPKGWGRKSNLNLKTVKDAVSPE
ncbi:hypothetical protein MBLNU13_g06549t1 [Cladosporium sp. NU13]